MKRCRIAASAAALLLAACTSITPVSPAGKDTYLIAGADTVMEVESGVNIKARLYQRADTFCQTNGKQFLPLNESVGSNSAQLRFRCLSENDPELRRPNMEPVPDIRVESK